jgi:hypothetical protein
MKTPNKQLTNKTKTTKREAYHHMPRRSSRVTGQVVAPIARDPTIAPKDAQIAASKQDDGKMRSPDSSIETGSFGEYPREGI